MGTISIIICGLIGAGSASKQSFLTGWIFLVNFSIALYSAIFLAPLAVALLVLLITLIFGFKWYLSLGLPLVLLSGLFIYAVVFIIIDGKPRKLMAFGALFFALSIYLILIDLVISRYIHGSFRLIWSYWPFVPLFTVGLMAMLFSRSIKISSWLKKKLFI